MNIDNNGENNNPEHPEIYDDYQYAFVGSNEGVNNAGVINLKRKKHKKKTIIIILILVTVIIALSLSLITALVGKGWLANTLEKNLYGTVNIPIQSKPQLSEEYYDEQTGKYTTQGIAKKVLPSIVSIEVFEKGVSLSAAGQGSGIIITEDGYIITNAHVVENATRAIKVILNNDKTYEAALVGMDTQTDLAVIKISEKGLTAADIGDSKQLEIGEEIIALGCPAGLKGSLTKGVVSALNRKISTAVDKQKMDCIQIDASINPGNSGGALVNMYGQVIGINTSKCILENVEGIGFAISMDAAVPIFEDLMKYGYFKQRPRIGVTFSSIDESVAKQNDVMPGLYIIKIDNDCDIAKTELEVDDIVTKLNGKTVTNGGDVSEVLKDFKPGDQITAEVFRKTITGEKSTFDIKFKLMDNKAVMPLLDSSLE